MKTSKLIKTIFANTTLLLLFACVKGGANKASSSATPESSEALTYLYQDVAPEIYGGTWKRVWSLTGPYSDDLAVDEMTGEEDANWNEIARTNRNGVFVQKDTTKKVKYRFDGHIETPWMPTLSDAVISSANEAHNVYSARRCVIPAEQTVVLGSRKITLRCKEIIIEGNLVAYPEGSQSGGGAGSVEILGENISIKGKILLIGDKGTLGINGRHESDSSGTPCSNGAQGGQGGTGGILKIKATHTLDIEYPEHLRVSGGPGGTGGRAGGGRNCSNGPLGSIGAEGFAEITKP